MRLLGWALIHCDQCPHKKRREHTKRGQAVIRGICAHRGKTSGGHSEKVGHWQQLQEEERGLRRNQTTANLTLKF